MNWNRRYAIKSYLLSTVWTAPVLALLLKQATFRLTSMENFHGTARNAAAVADVLALRSYFPGFGLRLAPSGSFLVTETRSRGLNRFVGDVFECIKMTPPCRLFADRSLDRRSAASAARSCILRMGVILRPDEHTLFVQTARSCRMREGRGPATGIRDRTTPDPEFPKGVP